MFAARIPDHAKFIATSRINEAYIVTIQHQWLGGPVSTEMITRTQFQALVLDSTEAALPRQALLSVWDAIAGLAKRTHF
jgi:hypothetical protein